MKKTLFLFGMLVVLLLVGCNSHTVTSSLSSELSFDASQKLCPQVVSRSDSNYSVLKLNWGSSADEVKAQIGVSAVQKTEDAENCFSVPIHFAEIDADGNATFYFSQEKLCLIAFSIPVGESRQDELQKWIEKYQSPLQLSGSADWAQTGCLAGKFENGDEMNVQFADTGNGNERVLILSIGQSGKNILNYSSSQ